MWLLQGVGGWRVACVVGESGMPVPIFRIAASCIPGFHYPTHTWRGRWLAVCKPLLMVSGRRLAVIQRQTTTTSAKSCSICLACTTDHLHPTCFLGYFCRLGA